MNRAKALLILMATAIGLAVASLAGANLGGSDDSSADDPNVAEARKAIEAQEWPRAISLLTRAAESNALSADVHNLLGYAYRKSGNLDAAFKHYRRALELEPQHKHAHEYIGEAYLMTGNVAQAEQHLAQLRKICTPIPCEEVRELGRAIDEYRKSAR